MDYVIVNLTNEKIKKEITNKYNVYNIDNIELRKNGKYILYINRFTKNIPLKFLIENNIKPKNIFLCTNETSDFYYNINELIV